jgi:MoaA/NifB/PqqE/SkfB family radical SAM enzyme
MNATLARWSGALGRLFGGRERIETIVQPHGPVGDVAFPSAGDGQWEVVDVRGRACLQPDERSYYLYAVLPDDFLARVTGDVWLEVEYYGSRYGEFRVQYASLDRSAEHEGLYAAAEQRWDGEAAGLERFRRAYFRLARFDGHRRQNLGASLRFEFRRDLRLARVAATFAPPPDLDAFPQVAPLPELRKLPGRFYPINYLFIEITNACNFKCTWCPDEIMDRRRGFMKKEKVFRLLDEVAEKRAWLGPLYPVKLHQMGEPMLHPELAEIVAYSEARGVPIELNTNCGLITEERIDALYRAGLTNLILSYQTPDLDSFKTRKAPRISFDEYRGKVRLAVERKAATGARTNVEIDIMNTKHAEGFEIVSQDDRALAFVSDWIEFCQDVERRHGLPPRAHDWERIRTRSFLDADENGSRYELLPGVTLIWKRCHTWGNVIGGHGSQAVVDTYCPAPYDQFVVQWNGDVVSCCTDYEGHTKSANVFAESIEGVWRGTVVERRKRDMLAGRLLDVCARCQGLR